VSQGKRLISLPDMKRVSIDVDFVSYDYANRLELNDRLSSLFLRYIKLSKTKTYFRFQSFMPLSKQSSGCLMIASEEA